MSIEWIHTMRFHYYLSFLNALCSIMNVTSSIEQSEERRRIVGGYSSNTQSEDVQNAADYVLAQLQDHKGDYSFSVPPGTSSRLKAYVLESQQQVVAGMNFRLKLGLFEGKNCLGGLSCTVFRDLKGNYSISVFGEEISCDTVLTMKNELSDKKASEDEESEDIE